MKRLKILFTSNFLYIALMILSAIYLFISTVFIKYESVYNINDNYIEGIITDYERNEEVVKLEVSAKEKIIVYTTLTDTSNLLGSKIKATGNLQSIRNNTLPNTFSYKNYLYYNKIYYIFYATDIQVINSSNIFYTIKNNLINHINKYSTKEYLHTFILGNKDYLSDNTYNIYQDLGTAHLLAISGLHISLFIGILNKILNRFKYKSIIIFTYLLFYLFITNYAISILRCFIYYILKIINKYLNLNINNIKLLILCFILLIVYNPFNIYLLSFQYSFIITFFIMLYKPKKNKLINILNISIIAFLASLPITVNANYEVNILSIISNIILVPFISYIVYPLSLITFIFPFLDNIFSIVIYVLENINYIIYKYIFYVIYIPKTNIIIVFIYYIFLYLTLKSKKFIIALIICIYLSKLLLKLDSNYYIYFLDVGQGDSTLLISPYKSEVILIDTGGNLNYDLSESVSNFLKSIGINKIDVMVLTHGDYDHLGEFIELSYKISIDSVIINNNTINEEEGKIIALDYKLVNNIDSNYFKANNINLYTSEDENESSLVYYFNLYNTSVLLPADITSELLSDIVNNYNINPLIYKVAHHGSKYNTTNELIKNINPYYAIISAGYNNKYNHPHEEVINILENHNVKIYDTSKDGTIMFKISENTMNIYTYKP